MIIIDEGAENKLLEALRSLDDSKESYCIHIPPVEANSLHAQQTIVTQAQEYFPDANLYVCEDGEKFLLTQVSSLKDCRKALLKIADALNIQPAEKAGEIYELSLSTSLLLIVLEKKIEKQQKLEEAVLQQQEKKQIMERATRKRHEILDHSVSKTPEQIAVQRQQREEPLLMIIEDDPFSQRLVANVLRKKYGLKGLESAEYALAHYAETAPDMLLLDINLPDVTGHELLEKIMTLDPKAYVVMLSGNADRNNILQATQRGAVGFIAKPFSRDKLFQYIERCPTIKKENVV